MNTIDSITEYEVCNTTLRKLLPALQTHASPSRKWVAVRGDAMHIVDPQADEPSRPSHSRPRRLYDFSRLLLCTLQAASPLCKLFCSFFCFLAAGLKAFLILRSPPRYSQVQTKTTAKLKRMYAHMMPKEYVSLRPLEQSMYTYRSLARCTVGRR